MSTRTRALFPAASELSSSTVAFRRLKCDSPSSLLRLLLSFRNRIQYARDDRWAAGTFSPRALWQRSSDHKRRICTACSHDSHFAHPLPVERALRLKKEPKHSSILFLYLGQMKVASLRWESERKQSRCILRGCSQSGLKQTKDGGGVT